MSNKLNNELIEKLKQNPPESLKFYFKQTLEDVIHDWWSDVFTSQSNFDMHTSIQDLIDRIEAYLPNEQICTGSQNTYVDIAVETWNDCLKQIKSKLRNK